MMRIAVLLVACVASSGHARRVQSHAWENVPAEGLAQTLLTSNQEAFKMPFASVPSRRSSEPRMYELTGVPTADYHLVAPLPTDAKPFAIEPMPYAYEALSPPLDGAAVKALYEDYHAWYVDTLNKEAPDAQALDDLALNPDVSKANYYAANVWAYNLMWKSMAAFPNGGGVPTGAVRESIKKGFGTFGNFADELTKAADFYGAGSWVFMIQNHGKLEIAVWRARGALLPVALQRGAKPILAMHVPEYQSGVMPGKEPQGTDVFVRAFLKHVNWDFASSNLDTTAKDEPVELDGTTLEAFLSQLKPSQRAKLDALTGGKPAAQKTALAQEQHFLEFEPYYDQSTMPNNLYKPKDPFVGKIISTKKIVGEGATGETFDIVIDHNGDMPYIEGQSYGVIPPGTNAKGKPNKVRLYSIASSRYGDDMTGKTTTLCVRRATYWCPELKAEDPAKKGVCSNFLCDSKAGDVVKLTGPTGKVMLLPEDKPETDIIMVATGTGIAPMRSFLRRMFAEKTPYAKDFKGLAWLFLGVANSDALLYDDEWKSIEKSNPDHFRYDVALSREQKNKDGGKMYIQDKVEEYSDEIFQRLDKGAHIYFCGLRGMMPGIEAMLEKVAKAKGLDYTAFIKKLKKGGQWHVEVY